ncbi:hypothetical protein RD055328_09110 [Companilactobacillus sp. RD055328]|nr:hypothetical protein RD055328_09110 [Companilactobacillus sp. RD055328]
MNMLIKYKTRKASVLLISIIALQLTTTCLLIKVTSFQNEVKVNRELDNYYQKEINSILYN